MRIENKSAFHQTQRLLPIVDFVTQYVQYSGLATVRFTDRMPGKSFTGGKAYKQRPDLSDLNLVAPSLVLLQLSNGARYPRKNTHVLGQVTVDSWEEEVLVVLAHELRHVDQFWSKPFTDEYEAEVDAEQTALGILKAWRDAQIPEFQKAA